uniref:Retroviral polymerase SH3-like domain-containing protein n=1 Tax=Rhizophora mucronata TaxID=61149 RepID=A0A2P2QTV9_RHIMU
MINRLPSRVLDFKTLMAVLSNFYPHLRITNNLIPRIFGCTSFVHVHNQQRGKLDSRAIKCVFLGYSSTQKGYKCYHHPSRKTYILVDITFVENKPFFPQSYLQGEKSLVDDLNLDLPPNNLPIQAPTCDQPIPDQSTSDQSASNSDQQAPPELVRATSILDSPSTIEPIPEQESTSISPLIYDSMRFSQVDSRKIAIPDQTQVQDFHPGFANEFPVSSDSPLHKQSIDMPENDLHLPIAIRKGTRECTKQPLYPLSHYMSLDHLSPSHKDFIVSLNTFSIPSTLSEALSKKE